jgi:hypothetical protein
VYEVKSIESKSVRHARCSARCPQIIHLLGRVLIQKTVSAEHGHLAAHLPKSSVSMESLCVLFHFILVNVLRLHVRTFISLVRGNVRAPFVIFLKIY